MLYLSVFEKVALPAKMIPVSLKIGLLFTDSGFISQIQASFRQFRLLFTESMLLFTDSGFFSQNQASFR